MDYNHECDGGFVAVEETRWRHRSRSMCSPAQLADSWPCSNKSHAGCVVVAYRYEAMARCEICYPSNTDARIAADLTDEVTQPRARMPYADN
jgi:hypothetical protein